jgi:hypothetical protein
MGAGDGDETMYRDVLLAGCGWLLEENVALWGAAVGGAGGAGAGGAYGSRAASMLVVLGAVALSAPDE